MQWASMLFLIGILLLWTTSTASLSNVSPRELKVLKAALKKQQRLKEQQQRSNKGVAASMGGSGEYVPDVGPWSSSDANEPTCEQLREMWRQSKRHSRAAEASNEIPQYADPFARATALYGRQLAAEPTMRPRSERRPVVYGRLHSSPSVDFESSDRTPRPFDVLRKISRTETEGLSGGPGGQSGGSSTSGVVLYGEKDRSPFAESSIKGSLQHLRDLVRDEQAGSGVKGSFQQLRNIVREENRDRPSSLPSRSDWSDADIGRVVTSPSDHGSSASKYSLFAMQGDAPYESPSLSQPSSEQHHHYNARRPAAAAFNYNHHNNRMPIKSQQHRNHNHNSNRQQPSVNEQLEAASRKPFQLRDPPRARMGSTSNRLATATASSRIGATGSNSNRWSDSEDVGVIRGYMQPAGRSNNNPLFSSKPTRRSSTLAADAVSRSITQQQVFHHPNWFAPIENGFVSYCTSPIK